MEQVVWNSRFKFIFRQEASSAKIPPELKAQGETFLKKNQGSWVVYHAQPRGLKTTCFGAIWGSL